MATTKQIGDQLEIFVERALKKRYGEDLDVERGKDVIVCGRQVDVRATLTNLKFMGPLLVSCKNEKEEKVDPEHAFNWSKLVEMSGASVGIIVSTAGFTSGAIEFARSKRERIVLWHCRESTADDFGMQGIEVQNTFWHLVKAAPRMHLKGVEVTGNPQQFQATEEFSPATRDRWTYGNGDSEFGNLWDDYQTAVNAAPPSEEETEIEVPVSSQNILTREGRRFYAERFTVTLCHRPHRFTYAITFTTTFPRIFENVVDGTKILIDSNLPSLPAL